jgi:hypothetical protein
MRAIFKNPPHRDLNPPPSGLQHSALTTTLPRRYVDLQIALAAEAYQHEGQCGWRNN